MKKMTNQLNDNLVTILGSKALKLQVFKLLKQIVASNFCGNYEYSLKGDMTMNVL